MRTRRLDWRAQRWNTCDGLSPSTAYAMRPDRKKPLYRKVNTRTHGVRHGDGGQAKWDRNTKKTVRDPSMRGSMHGKHRHGLDYTPLFKFLISKVGQDWDAVHSEAVSRLDNDAPIYWLVAMDKEEGEAFVRVGENSYFSGLYVTDNNQLALVDPDLTVDKMMPTCPCCTHTLNGERFTQSFGATE